VVGFRGTIRYAAAFHSEGEWPVPPEVSEEETKDGVEFLTSLFEKSAK
jgi:hypothetical protein